jgi:hypothetical protein
MLPNVPVGYSESRSDAGLPAWLGSPNAWPPPDDGAVRHHGDAARAGETTAV